MLLRQRILWRSSSSSFISTIHSAPNFLFCKLLYIYLYIILYIFLFLSIRISEFSTGKFQYHFIASFHASCPIHSALSYQCNNLTQNSVPQLSATSVAYVLELQEFYDLVSTGLYCLIL